MRRLRLRELLDAEELGLRLLVAPEEEDETLLDRPVTAVPIIDRADPGRFLTGGELVLTGLAWWHGDGDAEAYVRVLDRAGVTALAAGEVEHGLVPDDLVHACLRHGLPLFAVRPETAFATITEYALRRLQDQDFGGLAAVVERHRQLLAAKDTPGSVLELLRHSRGLNVRVLSATGRQVAGVNPPLRTRTATALASRYLAARRAHEQAPYRFTTEKRHYDLFPIEAPGERPQAAKELGDWLIVAEADTSLWPPPDLQLLHHIVELVTDARSAHERSKAALHDLATRLLDLMRRRIPPEEIPVRLRSTAQGVVSQVDTWPRCQFVVAEGTWQGDRPIPPEALRVLMEEALLQEHPIRITPQDIASTTDADQTVLLALVPTAALDLPALQRRLSATLTRWLGPTDSVSIGASTPVAEPGNAQRALNEARTALRVAQDAPDRVTVQGPEDLTQHILSLLPLIPPETRQAFATRLLGPLRDHDRRHRTDLLTTLETFLTCDASWTTCAAQLHLHVNSLRHRITRIEQLTGRDLTRLETKLDFLAALRAL
ncbi:PucR family transcriptional regulator [Streptomyces sp. NPDC001927]